MAHRLLIALFAMAALVGTTPTSAQASSKITITIIPACGPGGVYELTVMAGMANPLLTEDTYQVAVSGSYKPGQDPPPDPPTRIFTFKTRGFSDMHYFYFGNGDFRFLPEGTGGPHPTQIDYYLTLTKIIVTGYRPPEPMLQGLVIPELSGCSYVA